MILTIVVIRTKTSKTSILHIHNNNKPQNNNINNNNNTNTYRVRTSIMTAITILLIIRITVLIMDHCSASVHRYVCSLLFPLSRRASVLTAMTIAALLHWLTFMWLELAVATVRSSTSIVRINYMYSPPTKPLLLLPALGSCHYRGWHYYDRYHRFTQHPKLHQKPSTTP